MINISKHNKYLEHTKKLCEQLDCLINDSNLGCNELINKKIQEIKIELQKIETKKYGLVWEEKVENVDIELNTKYPFLKEIKEKEIKHSKDDITHILIEGDNLHSLNTLMYTHHSKIDLAIIDPPYNTNNKDFIYNDKFIGEDDEYRHSKWLSFMKPRLELAKELLKEDGVIFINIDDNEFAQLKLLCEDIFSKDNVEVMIWNKIGTGSSSEKMKKTKRFRRDHEYIIVAYKNKSISKFNKMKEVRNYKQKLKNNDNDIRGEYKAGCICRSEEKSNKKSSKYYTVESPSGRQWTREWLVYYDEFKQLDKDNRIYWGKDFNGTPSVKIFANEKSTIYPSSLILEKGSAAIANKELESIIPNHTFNNPKPLELIKYILEMSTNDNYIILDFFAGSGTTGHAVLDLNKQYGTKRQFILCTNNEVNEKKEKEIKKELKKIGINENTDEWKIEKQKKMNEEGICTKITYPRLQKVINGYEFNGKEEIILYEQSINDINDLENSYLYIEEAKNIKEKNSNKYKSIKINFENNCIKTIGINHIKGFKEGLGGNLKYYKTEFVEKPSKVNGRIKADVKRELSLKCEELLCIKENIFDKESIDKDFIKKLKNKDFNIYTNSFKVMGVYSKQINYDDLEKINDLFKSYDKNQKILYLFIDETEIDEIPEIIELKDNGINIVPIPQKIMDIYDSLR